jgi:acetylornithine deacetylase
MHEIIGLLKKLISKHSVSKDEYEAAEVIRDYLTEKKVIFHVNGNNTWAPNLNYDNRKQVILLNSHIDTVSPAPGWTGNPFSAAEEWDRITGLGSNDAGGAVVALLATFLHFYDQEGLPYNLIYSATAEEEISGENGVQSIFKDIQPVHFAIIGEPTGMELAVAEKGLMVLDCTIRGKAGHAARDEGENALYKALDGIGKLRDFRFDKVSDILGPVKLTVTQIEAGTQHNVIPDICRFVVDVRTNELYSNREIIEIISGMIGTEVKARSSRLNSSGIDTSHPFVVRARDLGIRCFGSPTTSDQAIMPWPSVKIGPGDSARSHTANEFILKSEIQTGIQLYIKLLEGLHLETE